MRLGGFVLLLGIAGCISDPTFEQANGASTTTTTETTVSTNDDMVLVPTTTLGTLSTKDANKGKGKGGDDDKKKPTPAPSPSPSPSLAPTSTSSPTPSPSGSSDSGVVPAFWIDRVAVSPADYDACIGASSCTRPSCVSLGNTVACVTHIQAAAYCAWKTKRLVRDAEWSAAAKQMPAGLTGLSGGFPEWVDAPGGASGIARGGATSNASMPLGLDSSIPTVGFRCARDR